MSLQAKYSSRRDNSANNPGKLDRRVSLLATVVTQSALGEPLRAWASFATVWASKTSLTGSRLMVEDAKNNLAMVRFRIRHRNDVGPMQRIVHGDDTYEIVNSSELGRRHFLDLECRAFNQSTSATTGGSPPGTIFASFTAYANASGDTAIAASANGYNTAQVTFSGAASTRNLILAAGSTPGAVMNLSLIFPAVLGIRAQVRNLTAGGTLMFDLSSDASGASAALELIWNGAAWTTFKSTYPA
jgi:SPP1 family predicted phage head-tail adaptor